MASCVVVADVGNEVSSSPVVMLKVDVVDASVVDAVVVSEVTAEVDCSNVVDVSAVVPVVVPELDVVTSLVDVVTDDSG